MQKHPQLIGKVATEDYLILISTIATTLQNSARPEDASTLEVWNEYFELFKKNTPFMFNLDTFLTREDCTFLAKEIIFGEKIRKVATKSFEKEFKKEKNLYKALLNIIEICHQYILLNLSKESERNISEICKRFDVEVFLKCIQLKSLQRKGITNRDNNDLINFCLKEDILSYIIFHEKFQRQITEHDKKIKSIINKLNPENTHVGENYFNEYLQIVINEVFFFFPSTIHVPLLERKNRNIFIKKIINKVDPLTYFYLSCPAAREKLLEVDYISDEEFKASGEAVQEVMEHIFDNKEAPKRMSSERFEILQKECPKLEELSTREKKDIMWLFFEYFASDPVKLDDIDSLKFLHSLNDLQLKRHFQFTLQNNHKIISIMEHIYSMQERYYNLKTNNHSSRKEDFRSEMLRFVARANSDGMGFFTTLPSEEEQAFNEKIFENCQTLLANLCSNPALKYLYAANIEADYMMLISAKSLAEQIVDYNNSTHKMVLDHEEKMRSFLQSLFSLKKNNNRPEILRLTANRAKAEDKFDIIIAEAVDNFNRRLKYALKKTA